MFLLLSETRFSGKCCSFFYIIAITVDIFAMAKNTLKGHCENSRITSGYKNCVLENLLTNDLRHRVVVFTAESQQAVRVATQYASAPCKSYHNQL